MKKYQWDTNEMLKNIRILFELLKNETNENIKETILYQISGYETVLRDIDCAELLDEFNEEIEYNNGFYIDNCSYSPLDLFKYNIKSEDNELIDLLDSTYPIVCAADAPLMYNNQISLNSDEIVNHSEQLLKSFTTQETYNKFLELKKNNPNFLHIQNNPTNSTLSSFYYGQTLIDHILNHKYITINKPTKLKGLVSLPHEMFHFIFNDYGNIITNEFQSNYISEIEGKFAEFITADFYGQEGSYISDILNDYSFSEYKKLIERMIVAESYISNENGQTQCNSLKDKNVFNTSLKSFNSNPNFWLGIPETEIIRYSLSYLAAFDLYRIYQKDRNEAFRILNNIKHAPATNNVLELLRNNNLTFMDDGCQNLKRLAISYTGR